jgi:hypothetical protein
MQKLSISGYVLKLNVRNVTKGLSFNLTNFLKAKIFVVYTVVRSSVRIVRNCFLKLLTELFLTGYTKRKKSSTNMTDSVRIDSLNDSPIESFKGWSLLDLIARYQVSLPNTELNIYRREVISCA